MGKKIFAFLNREVKGLHEAAYLLAVFALLSQVLGLVRDRLFAHNFGASEILDIYYAAFRIPDLIFVSVASIVSISVLIPFLIDRLTTEKDQAKEFLSNVFSIFLVFIVFVSAVVFFLIPYLVPFLFPGLNSEGARESLIGLSRILLLSPILLGLSNLFASVTQIYKRFFIYAISPILYNVGIIIGIIFLYPVFGLAGLGIGVVLGALLHLLVQIPAIAQEGFMPRFGLRFNFSEVKKVAALSLPRTLTLSASQIVLLFLISRASLMAEGSIAVFNFSFNLQSVPLAIIGVSYSVAAFPTLARLFSEGERGKFARQISSAARHILFWSFPAITLFIVLRAQIVRTILGSGEFTWSDTRLTAAALALFAFSIVSQALVLLFVRGYYAAGRTARPLIINVSTSLFIIVLSYGLTHLFSTSLFFQYFMESLLRIEGLPGSAVIMLPLAYSIGMIMNSLILWYYFDRDFQEFSFSIKKAFTHAFSSAVFMGVVAYHFLILFGRLLDITTFKGIFLQGLFSGVIGIISGVLLLRLLGNEEIEEISKSVRKKFWKSRVISADKESL
jgi:putative peptidoglycan lipid II flippase